MTSLSIIIPTIGRSTLMRALRSVIRELLPGDQIIVVGDGERPRARRICETFASVEYYETLPTGLWGHAQRNFGMEKAVGTHLAFLDDDDIWIEGARQQIEAAMKVHPDRPIFFRMNHMKRILWADQELRYGNVSTQMFLFPNDHGRLAKWRPNPEDPDGRGGDYLFAKDTVALYPPGSHVFVDAVIATLFEHSNGSTRMT